MSIGNETSKSARTCSLGTKRCGEGPLAAGCASFGALSSVFGGALALPSASAAAFSAASACSAMLLWSFG
jgi:hypothetical protein